jgi:hypothetical protein
MHKLSEIRARTRENAHVARNERVCLRAVVPRASLPNRVACLSLPVRFFAHIPLARPEMPSALPAHDRPALSQIVLAAVLLLSISRIHSQLVLDDLADDDELMQVLLSRSHAAAGAPAPMPPWLLE